MKTLIVNTFDSGGGAAIAAQRLHKGLIKIKVNSIFLVQRKATSDKRTIGSKNQILHRFFSLFSLIELLPLKFYPNRQKTFWSLSQYSFFRTAEKINSLKTDIVNLHWIGYGFLSIKKIAKIKRPIVWTLHDSWAFTGGCHLPGTCRGYKKSCGNCPQLNSKKTDDLSHRILLTKQKAWKDSNITIVCPSNWLKDAVKESTLFKNNKIIVIPNGVDTNIFKPHDKKRAKSELGLQGNKKYILFGAPISDPNKGFDYLLKAMKLVDKNIGLITFGPNQKNKIDCDFNIKHFGNISDLKKLALIYSATDVFVAPSRQENLPNTIMESMSCGRPVVAFRIGGIPDLIDHKKNGFLAEPYRAEDLAKGISWILEDEKRWEKLSGNARTKIISGFDIIKIAYQYKKLFASLLKNDQKKAKS